MVQTDYSAVQNFEVRRGFFVSRVKAFVALFLLVLLVIVLVVLAALLAHERGKENNARVKDDGTGLEIESTLTSMSCDVVVVGSDISGMYMAETLIRMKKESNVCLFEKDSRFGGRIYDFRFSQAPNITISLGPWRVDKQHKTVMDLVRRFNIPVSELGHTNVALYEAREFYATSPQSLKEQAYPALSSGPFGNMTVSEMLAYVWTNMTTEKALEFPSVESFKCQRLGSEGCDFVRSTYGFKVDYNQEESTLFSYERNQATKYFSSDYVRPLGGMTDITTALERSAKSFGVKMYLNEKVKALNRKGDMFAVRTDNFSVSAKKLIIAVPSFPLREITGDVAAEIQANYLFEAILARPCFRAAAIYSYAWWENATLFHNITLNPFEIFTSVMTCLDLMMPYSGRGPHGEAVIQLSFSFYGCAPKWGKLSQQMPKAAFEAELKKAVQAVFPGIVVPEPLDMVFKYWDNTCWHQTKAGSNVSRYDLEKWAKRPFPGEEIYVVGEAYSVIPAFDEGALRSAYYSLKEGWGIVQPEL